VREREGEREGEEEGGGEGEREGERALGVRRFRSNEVVFITTWRVC